MEDGPAALNISAPAPAPREGESCPGVESEAAISLPFDVHATRCQLSSCLLAVFKRTPSHLVSLSLCSLLFEQSCRALPTAARLSTNSHVRILPQALLACAKTQFCCRKYIIIQPTFGLARRVSHRPPQPPNTTLLQAPPHVQPLVNSASSFYV